MKSKIATIISLSFLVTMSFLYCTCSKFSDEAPNAEISPNAEAVDAETPRDVVERLLQAIERKDWERACEYFSSDFLRDNEEKVIRGTYFKRSGRKDRTSFYTSKARVAPEWRLEKDGELAIVTLNIGGGEPGALIGICEVKLVKEYGHWKVTEF